MEKLNKFTKFFRKIYYQTFIESFRGKLTYNFPQNRITDHRIEFSIHSLEAFLDGDMDEMVETLIEENQARLLSQLEEKLK